MEEQAPLGIIERDGHDVTVFEDKSVEDDSEDVRTTRWIDQEGRELVLTDEEFEQLYAEEEASLPERVNEIGSIQYQDEELILYRDPKTGNHYIWQLDEHEVAELFELTNLDEYEIEYGGEPQPEIPELREIYSVPGEPKETTEELTVSLTDHEVAEMAMEAAQKTKVKKQKEELRSKMMKELKEEADELQADIDNILDKVEKGGEQQIVDVEVYYDWEHDVKYFIRQDNQKCYKAEWIEEHERQSDLFDENSEQEQVEPSDEAVDESAEEMEAEMDAEADDELQI